MGLVVWFTAAPATPAATTLTTAPAAPTATTAELIRRNLAPPVQIFSGYVLADSGYTNSRNVYVCQICVLKRIRRHLSIFRAIFPRNGRPWQAAGRARRAAGARRRARVGADPGGRARGGRGTAEGRPLEEGREARRAVQGPGVRRERARTLEDKRAPGRGTAEGRPLGGLARAPQGGAGTWRTGAGAWGMLGRMTGTSDATTDG